jgi:SnoaL-like domain
MTSDTQVSASVLQRLDDVERLKRLKARYFRLLDTRDWDGWRRLFTADARVEMAGAVYGPDAFRDVTRDWLGEATSVHQGFLPEIEITGPDTATGVWAMHDSVVLPATEGGAARGLRGYGHYHERYRKIGGEWLIAGLTLTRLLVEPLPGGLPGGA